jgi:hypothetical protein
MTRPMSPGTRRNARVRCAIYTRKSSEEGLEQEFNSLQAQREACEAFITSQRHDGWVCLRAGYDDGAFSGATMGRPALQRLLRSLRISRPSDPRAREGSGPGRRPATREGPKVCGLPAGGRSLERTRLYLKIPC